MTEKRYWKSLQLEDGKIVSARDESPWTVGEWRSVPSPTESCVGLNCCENIVDAMGYVEMEVLAEVEIAGVLITGGDKITAEKMRVLRAWKWEKKDSVAMAIYAAELTIENFEKVYPNDKRPREAIEAAKAWIINQCSDMGSAAESAARSAARSAAWSAESAAWSAVSAVLAARSAAWSAVSAESAARSAARSAESALWSAAESAVREKTKLQIHDWIVNRIAVQLKSLP